MKIFFKLLFAVLMTTVAFTACTKNDYNYEEALREQQQKEAANRARIKTLINQQATSVKAFADEHIPGAMLHDSTGIWFKVIQVGEENSYEYRATNTGIVSPTVTVKYKGTLLNGNIFDQTEEGKSNSFSLADMIYAWHVAFLPKSLYLNGEEIKVNGLSQTGLKKGSIIQFVTPSPWAYDAAERKDNTGNVIIPANSPLYFEVEVIDIK